MTSSYLAGWINRQISRLGTPTSVDTGLAIRIGYAAAIAHDAPDRSEFGAKALEMLLRREPPPRPV
jgi:hypothetical protein